MFMEVDHFPETLILEAMNFSLAISLWSREFLITALMVVGSQVQQASRIPDTLL